MVKFVIMTDAILLNIYRVCVCVSGENHEKKNFLVLLLRIYTGLFYQLLSIAFIIDFI